MSYISAITKGDNVIVWERDEYGRQEKTYPAPFFFFSHNNSGKYTSIFGDKLSKHEFSSARDFYGNKKTRLERGETLFESDIPSELRILSSQYYGKKAPTLNISFYDIEVDYDPALGFSSVLNPYAPINSISLLHYWSNKMFVLAIPPSDNIPDDAVQWNEEQLYEQVLNCAKDATINNKYSIELILCKDERELLLTFLELIEDSDVICGWNSDMFDTPYVGKRVERVLGNTQLYRLDFLGATPRFREVYSKVMFDKDTGKPKLLGETLDLYGRLSADYMVLYKKYEPGERASYKLASIEQEVGLNLPKLEYEGTLHDLYRKNFPFFLRYNIRDTEILGGFEETLGYVELANQMYHISCGLFSYVPGTIKLAEYAIVNYCHHELNRIVPDFKRSDTDRSIQGALVLLPQIGEHKWTGSIDINSLYPSSIRSINISPETLRGQFMDCEQAVVEISKQSDMLLAFEVNNSDETITKTAAEWRAILQEKKWAISGYGTVFDQSVPGIIPTILGEWYAQRKKYQALKKDAEKEGNTDLASYYDRLQYVYKIKLNSLYGALTNLYFRFFDLRMGESTTATGRMILKHQCRKVSEFLGDGYDVDFPLYNTVDDGGTNATALNGPVFNGSHMAKSVIYGDTDSTYFNTYANDKAEAILIADTVAQGVNDSYPEFMRNMFLCTDGYDNIIKAGREVVSDNGIFVDKKRYILHIIDMEGKEVDKTKTMGLDTKKTTLPKAVGDKLNDYITSYLKGTPWDTIAASIIEYKDSLRNSSKIMDIGLPKGVKSVEDYTREYERIGDSVRLPGHVAASIFYNKCLKEYNDTVSPPIISGTKIKVFYLTQKYGKFKSIAIPTDAEFVPEWFLTNFSVDYDAHIERLVDNPLENIIRAIGRRSPNKRDMLIDSVFEF